MLAGWNRALTSAHEVKSHEEQMNDCAGPGTMRAWDVAADARRASWEASLFARGFDLLASKLAR